VIDIRLLSSAAAEDGALIDGLVRLINAAYAEGEIGLWIEDTARIDHDEIEQSVSAGEMLIATDAGRTVGCARTRMLDPETADVGLITAAPEAWGTGIGRELVRTAEHLARSRGATTMQLELLVPRHGTHPAKERLRGWYTRRGYRIVRSVPLEDVLPRAAPYLAAPGELLIFRKPLRNH
jgi:GNAT superfamily N-acetyltransferase